MAVVTQIHTLTIKGGGSLTHTQSTLPHMCLPQVAVSTFELSERDIPLELLELAFGERHTYIGQAELLAVAAAVETYPDIFKDSDVVCFVDNQGALGILVSGSSSDAAMGRLAHDVAKAQMAIGSRFFYEYVPSKANIADLPSRGELNAVAEMLRVRFRADTDKRDLQLPHLRAVAVQ